MIILNLFYNLSVFSIKQSVIDKLVVFEYRNVYKLKHC